MSVEYYTRLERGSLGGVSDAVLDALATALRMDGTERTHLQALIDALFTGRFTTFLRLADEAEQQPDPGRALLHYLLAAAQWRARDQALDIVLAHANLDAKPVSGIRDELGRHVDGLVERARAAGAVRDDFESADVYAFLYMIGAVADRTHAVAPDAWRRYTEVLLSGFGMDLPDAARTSAMTNGQVRQSWPEPTDAPYAPSS
ncbi:helix-turn-helix transcriptional regulator [Streptomyces sp. NPDC002790]|uniref:helix-turn-helix domain-containing protein n=1 Tax=Streptomyces sp. NPDC002790 TaxID=3154431 RepID=UPI003327320A